MTVGCGGVRGAAARRTRNTCNLYINYDLSGPPLQGKGHTARLPPLDFPLRARKLLKNGWPPSLWPPDPVSRTDGTQPRGAAQAPWSAPQKISLKSYVFTKILSNVRNIEDQRPMILRCGERWTLLKDFLLKSSESCNQSKACIVSQNFKSKT